MHAKISSLTNLSRIIDDHSLRLYNNSSVPRLIREIREKTEVSGLGFLRIHMRQEI